MSNQEKNKLSQEKRSAITMIENSKYMGSINRVTTIYSVYENCVKVGDLQDAERQIDRMIALILDDSTN